MILKFDMDHRGLKHYKVCINDDLLLTLKPGNYMNFRKDIVSITLLSV